MLRDYPHYGMVPKGMEENVAFRLKLLEEASVDAEFAASLRAMCAQDALFYMNVFGWTYDPRDTKLPKKPFITYEEFQDEAIDKLLDAIERGYDVAIPKSRTMGASWMGLFVFEYLWHFFDELSFLLVSRNEDYVDKKGNPKSLFWKLDYIHENQPRWLLPTGRWLGGKDPNRKQLHLRNLETLSVIDGESTTGDAARGDRRTAMFVDEHAAFDLAAGFAVLSSSRDATKCRIFNSTPQGSNNAFYEVVHGGVASILRLHWSSHPSYNEGLYTSEKNSYGEYELKIIKPYSGIVKVKRKEWPEPREMQYPEDYPFILDGKMRSPWYDAECSRCVSDQEVGQELDIDFVGSDYPYFDPSFINLLIAEYCVPPKLTGRLKYNPVTLDPEGFEVDAKGPLHLWFHLRGSDPVLTDRQAIEGGSYAIGSDVSFGTGASNSASSVVDLKTGRKVAVWRDPRTKPEKFADETIVLAKWFNTGFMIWDASGAAGRIFTARVMEKKYPRIYYRKAENRTRARQTDQPGYYLNPEDRTVLLGDYRQKLTDRQFINQSEPGMKECLQFITQPGGRVEHSAAARSQDPSGAREAHGDEAIADALASRALTLRRTEVESQAPKVPWMSPAWRLQEEERKRLEAERVDW